MFERTNVAVDGELRWQIKRPAGLITTKSLDVTTVDLSVDGARVHVQKKTRLPTGASVLLTFHGCSSAARIRAILPNPDKSKGQLLLLQFDQPSPDFLQIVDQWVDTGKGGNTFKAEYWRNREAELAAAEQAKTEARAAADADRAA